MKVAVVYNRESKKVINIFGQPSLEKYGRKSIDRIVRCLRQGGHQVEAFEGDKDLIDRLEEFMPRVLKGERPGMVFNLAYGIQGKARYTHVPGILEMIGLPYVGSGPLAHSLALDKVVAKMIFLQHGLPTPQFTVLETADFPSPDLPYPLIVKPRNEAVSMGIQVVHDEEHLHRAVGAVLDKFRSPVLVEQYIEGREINVGILGNHPALTLPPAELDFGDGPRVYTIEDKKKKSGREVKVVCPAPLDPEIAAKAQDVSLRAFRALDLYDCARVDLRLDADGNLYILEINSLPSLGEHGSYTQGAMAIGLDFCALVNRLVEEAALRYFGPPAANEPIRKKSDANRAMFQFVVSQRDRMENRAQQWTERPSRTNDLIGIRTAWRELERLAGSFGLQPVADGTDMPAVATWQTPTGLEGGTLLVGNLDVPLGHSAPAVRFRRDPEWLRGEGIGSTYAPLTAMEFALRALRKVRRLRDARLGIALYADEGMDGAHSGRTLERICAKVRNVLVLRPGSSGDAVVVGRRGLRHYKLTVEDSRSLRLGSPTRRPEVLRWLWDRLEQCCRLSSRRERVAVAVGDVKTTAYRMLLPHAVELDLMVGYPDLAAGDRVEAAVREILGAGRGGHAWHLELTVDRPPMPDRNENARLRKTLQEVAGRLDIPHSEDTSLLPSVAGLVPPGVSVVCGMGPAASEVYTIHESVQRISMVQRTLLLSHALLELAENGKGA